MISTGLFSIVQGQVLLCTFLCFVLTAEHTSFAIASVKRLDVVIIGAGPAGLSCALGLSQCCRQIHVIEKHPVFEKAGSTFGIFENGLQALSEVANISGTDMEQKMMLKGVSIPRGVMVLWWHMRDVILQLVLKKKNIQVYSGETWSSITEEEETDKGSLTVKCESGLTIQADLLVGADGVNSSIRSYLKLSPPISANSRSARGTLEVPTTASPRLQALLEDNFPAAKRWGTESFLTFFNFHRARKGQLAWTLATTVKGLDENIDPTTLLRQIESDPDELQFFEEVFSLSESVYARPFFIQSKVTDLSTCDMGRWGGRGHITLLGDAAHAMRPVSGQGGNMAFEDSAVLARIIKGGKYTSIPEALAEFESTRLSRVKILHQDQEEKAALFYEGESITPWTKEFEDWLFGGV